MRIFALCLAALLAPVGAGAQTRPVTVDDILALRVVGNAPAISPDGRAVLFTVRQWVDSGGGKKDARTAIWRAPADASAPARQITFGAGRSKGRSTSRRSTADFSSAA